MLTIRLLGGASVHDPGGSQRPIPPTPMALLALLAVPRDRATTRDRIMSILWAESDADRARHLLRENLY
jgi:DNA-binding SARP family transcriptional activator